MDWHDILHASDDMTEAYDQGLRLESQLRDLLHG